MKKLWQVDVLPYKNEKEETRSKEDQEALNRLEAQIEQVNINGLLR